MKVGCDHAQQRPPVKRTVEKLAPRLARGLIGDTAIDGSPASVAFDVVLEQPQVNVVEREGQRHAQPVKARAKHHGFTRFGGRGPGKIQLVFGRVHASRPDG